jgi:hypothetical protein
MTTRNYKIKITRDGQGFEAEGDKAFVLKMLARFETSEGVEAIVPEVRAKKGSRTKEVTRSLAPRSKALSIRELKFALLHVNQAVELILKECVRANGKSIYKNPKETITIWGAYEILSTLNVPIPERPNLEMLHEERNSIQHKYANLSAEDAAFHIDNAMRFIRRFLNSALKVDINDYVSAEYLDQF